MAEDEECLEKDPVLILDKMQEYGHLSQTYALHLKKNVQGIQSLLSECQKNEEILSSKTKLLKEEKNKLVKEISQLTQDLPSSAKKEIQRLRLELVKQGKALEEHSEKQLEIFQIIESLQVEKSDLLNKLLMNEEEVDNDEEEDKTPKFLSFRQLEKTCLVLRAEINEHQEEIKMLQESIGNLTTQMSLLEKENHQITNRSKEIKTNHSSATGMTAELNRANEKIQREKIDVMKLLQVVRRGYDNVVKGIKVIESESYTQNNMVVEVEKVLQQIEQEIEDRKQKYNILAQKIKSYKENYSELIQESSSREEMIRYLSVEHKSWLEAVHSVKSAIDKSVQQVRKEELKIETMKTSSDPYKTIEEELLQKLQVATDNHDVLSKQRNDFQNEMNDLKTVLFQQTARTQEEIAHAESLALQVSKVVKDAQQLQELTKKLSKMITLKVVEKDKKSVDIIRAEMRLQHIKDDLKSKQVDQEKMENCLSDNKEK